MSVDAGTRRRRLIPVVYAGDDAMTEPQRLGRETDWQQAEGGPVRGVGQRVFLLGEDDVAIMELGKLTFTGPAAHERTRRPRGTAVRVQAPLLDRLIDEAPDQARDPTVSVADTMAALRQSVRRDLEALLNARRRWRSWPKSLTSWPPRRSATAFRTSPRARSTTRAGARNCGWRSRTRSAASSRASCRCACNLVDTRDQLETTLRLRIDAVMHAEPAPKAVTFDTVVDPTTDNIVVRPGNVV